MRPVWRTRGGRRPSDRHNRAVAVRQNILDAVEALIGQGGFHAVSIASAAAAAAAAAGVGRLFERFPHLALAGAPTLGPNAALRGYIHLPARIFA